MSPEGLLTVLVQARRQLSTDLTTPFLLEKTDHALSSLSYPMLPDGGILVDAEMRAALLTLVQWGYLSQPQQYHSMGYLLTAAGLSYAARLDGTWDGTERRQQDRRAGGRRQAQQPTRADQRSTERRQDERRAI